MKAIETIVTVPPNRQLTLQLELPPDIVPGQHRIVLVIGQQPEAKVVHPPLEFPVDDYGPWSSDLTLRREEMYDDFEH